MNALKLADANQSAAVTAARSYNNSRSLGTILTPGTDTDLSIPIADLKLVRRLAVATNEGSPMLTTLCISQSVMEGIAELMDEIDSLHVNIADQAMEYIHAE